MSTNGLADRIPNSMTIERYLAQLNEVNKNRVEKGLPILSTSEDFAVRLKEDLEIYPYMELRAICEQFTYLTKDVYQALIPRLLSWERRLIYTQIEKFPHLQSPEVYNLFLEDKDAFIRIESLSNIKRVNPDHLCQQVVITPREYVKMLASYDKDLKDLAVQHLIENEDVSILEKIAQQASGDTDFSLDEVQDFLGKTYLVNFVTSLVSSPLR